MKSTPPRKVRFPTGKDKTPQVEEETDPEKMTPKERLKHAKVIRQWRESMNFLFRHLAVMTYRFNVFFVRELLDFAKAMSAGDEIRSQQKLKKKEPPRIHSIKTMLETADLMDAAQLNLEASKLRELADLSGRIRTWALMAKDMYRMIAGKMDDKCEREELDDEKCEELDKMKSLLDGIQSFTNRNYDFGLAKFVFRIDLSEYTELEKEYLTWPVAVRTALFNGSQFLQTISENHKIPVMEADPTPMLQNMQAAEYLFALNLDDELSGKNTEEQKQMEILLGSSAVKKERWRNPIVDDIEPEILQPIALRSLLLQFPKEIPQEILHKKLIGRKTK